MTTITIAQIEAVLRKNMMDNGTIMVRVADNTLAQMNKVAETMKEATRFEESKLTEDDLEIALGLAHKFHARLMGSSVIDGILVPETPETEAEAMEAVRVMGTHNAPLGFVLPCVLVNKLINETRCFAL